MPPRCMTSRACCSVPPGCKSVFASRWCCNTCAVMQVLFTGEFPSKRVMQPSPFASTVRQVCLAPAAVSFPTIPRANLLLIRIHFRPQTLTSRHHTFPTISTSPRLRTRPSTAAPASTKASSPPPPPASHPWTLLRPCRREWRDVRIARSFHDASRSASCASGAPPQTRSRSMQRATACRTSRWQRGDM